MLHSSPTAVISRQDGVSQSIEACVRACRGESAPDEGVEGEPKPWSIRCLRGLLVDLLVYGAPSEDFEAAETACIRRIRCYPHRTKAFVALLEEPLVRPGGSLLWE